jgi:hypothetical protein
MQRGCEPCRQPRVADQQGLVRERARVLSEDAQPFEQEWGDLAPADALSGRIRQGTLDGRLPHRRRQLVVASDRVRDNDARPGAERKMAAHSNRQGVDVAFRCTLSHE